MSWDRGSRAAERGRARGPLGQQNAARSDTMRVKTIGQLLSCLLTTQVGIDIEGEIDGARSAAKLKKLFRVEMGSQRTGHVIEARLPQHGVVKQSLDKNHLGAVPDLLPRV